jgi:patatin-like phospholipase/acyl hydrolase
MLLTRRCSKEKLMLRLVRVLSLDGGGRRGLTSLRILQRIAEHYDMEVSSDWTKLCDYFGQIGGTRTWG